MVFFDKAFFEGVGLFARAEDGAHGVSVSLHPAGVADDFLEAVVPGLEVPVHGFVDAVARETDIHDFAVLFDNVYTSMVARFWEGCLARLDVGCCEFIDFQLRVFLCM